MNRKFDKLGRINLPKEMRKKLGLDKAGSEAYIELIDNRIIITNPMLNDAFDDWLNDYILKTESPEAKKIYVKYQELKK